MPGDAINHFRIACIFLWEKEMSAHPSILAWRIPWTEEPGGLQFIGSHRVGLKWLSTHTRFPLTLHPDCSTCSLAPCIICCQHRMENRRYFAWGRDSPPWCQHLEEYLSLVKGRVPTAPVCRVSVVVSNLYCLKEYGDSSQRGVCDSRSTLIWSPAFLISLSSLIFKNESTFLWRTEGPWDRSSSSISWLVGHCEHQTGESLPAVTDLYDFKAVLGGILFSH